MGKKALMIISLVICALAIGGGVFYFTNIAPANKVLNEVRNAEIKDVDLNKVADGKYIGEFSYSSTTCKVEVTVNDHRIKGIRILENGKTAYAKRASKIIGRVITEQKTNVDVIAGATTTSKALLKAIGNALSDGIKQ